MLALCRIVKLTSPNMNYVMIIGVMKMLKLFVVSWATPVKELLLYVTLTMDKELMPLCWMMFDV